MSDIEMPAIDYMGTIAMQSRIIEQLEAANRLNAAQVAALRTRIKQLEAALRPFAEHGKPGVFGTLDVETPVSIVVEPHVVWLTDALKIWDFREARAELGEKE